MQRHVPDGDGSGEIMLFGVRVKVDPMRKSVSMNNLSQYHHPNINTNTNTNTNKTTTADASAGYASADDVVRRHSARQRKRGVPWTEEEHKLFLLGLQNVGKGHWRGISRNFIKTRTPTQVASHAQKYFLRNTNLNKRRRRRSSLFDITTHSVTATPMEEHEHQNNLPQQAPETPNIPVVPYPVSVGPAVNPIAGFSGEVNDTSLSMLKASVAVPLLESPAPSTAVDFSQTLTKDDPTLSLNLSLSFDHHNQQSSRQSVYQVGRNLSNGDGRISVV